MGRRSTERIRKTPGPSVQKWLAKLFTYWQAHGLANQTMDDWSIAVEKSKATLYAYFATKEEMVQAALAVKLENIRVFEVPLRDPALPYAERYRRSMELISPQLGEVSLRFLRDLATDFPEQRQMVDAFLDYVGQVLGKFYEEGVAAGAFRNTNTALLVQMDKVFLQQLTDASFLQNTGVELQEAVEYFIELKFMGLLR